MINVRRGMVVGSTRKYANGARSRSLGRRKGARQEEVVGRMPAGDAERPGIEGAVTRIDAVASSGQGLGTSSGPEAMGDLDASVAPFAGRNPERSCKYFDWRKDIMSGAAEPDKPRSVAMFGAQDGKLS